MKSRLMHRAATTLALIALSAPLGAMAAIASPTPPTVETLEFAAGELCDFPATLTLYDYNNGVSRSPSDPGVAFETGRFTITLTNESSGESLDANISGPVLQNPRGGFMFTGPSAGPTDREEGTGISLTRGRIVLQNFEVQSVSGNVRDLCAELG